MRMNLLIDSRARRGQPFPGPGIARNAGVERRQHIGVGLDWGDGRCKTGDNELTCALHGAVFAADSGACLAGPCMGQSLQRIPVRVEDGKVVAD